MASNRVRELAKQHPEAFREIAHAQEDNRVCNHLQDVLADVEGGGQSRAAASD